MVSPKEKTQLAPNPFEAPTAVGQAPLSVRATATPTPFETDVTVPGTIAKGVSPLSEVMSLVGERRPDLVEALLHIDRTYRAQAETMLKAQVTKQQQQLEELLRRAETMMNTARGVADDAVHSGVEKERQTLGELLARIDKQLADTNATGMRLDKLLAETERREKEALDEARTATRNYKQLLDKSIEEREVLVAEVRTIREQAASEAAQHHQTVLELQQKLERDKRDTDTRRAALEQELSRRDARLREVEAEINQALASRDRIAMRVAEVEAKQESTVEKMRAELDEVRAREAELKIQLENARREIAALKILTPPSSP
ncbi:MAG: hypothetical protein HY903_18025 [Deltaproteobacteria bacterium]|nr:hypothetical protein [Deltaproteobacteria bacterium]